MPGLLNNKDAWFSLPEEQQEVRSKKYRDDTLTEINFLEDICRKVRKDSDEKSTFMVQHLLRLHRSGKLDENTRLLIWNHLMFEPAPDQEAMFKFRTLLYEEIVEEFGYPFNTTQ